MLHGYPLQGDCSHVLHVYWFTIARQGFVSVDNTANGTVLSKTKAENYSQSSNTT